MNVNSVPQSQYIYIYIYVCVYVCLLSNDSYELDFCYNISYHWRLSWTRIVKINIRRGREAQTSGELQRPRECICHQRVSLLNWQNVLRNEVPIVLFFLK